MFVHLRILLTINNKDMENVIVKQSAVTNKKLNSSIKEAIKSNKESGTTKAGINFKKLLNALILF
jgi:hypothetical protein